MTEQTPKTEPKTETKKKPTAIVWEPRMQFAEGSDWWEVLEIDSDAMTCICAARNKSRIFKKSEVDQLVENYRKSQAG